MAGAALKKAVSARGSEEEEEEEEEKGRTETLYQILHYIIKPTLAYFKPGETSFKCNRSKTLWHGTQTLIKLSHFAHAD